jgi:FlaA1/EpsC-like NDP-sugar epimerase
MLITGGTGSFGQAFVKRLLDDGKHERICIYSRDEYKQALMREKFNDDQRLRFLIGDVRDRDRLRRAMEGVEVVIHAAALKRIETCFYNPSEMVQTNVIGSMNVIEAAHDAKVKKVIALSTDKAFQPVSAYGYSKGLAEGLFLAANYARGKCGPMFAVTRYGNVSGSTGSVIPKWRELISQAGNDFPCVPVTDPECTRFWMTLEESVDLVMDTIKTMRGGELNIPTLPAYRIGDLAAAMRTDIEVIGLPDFEKRHESMAEGNSSDKARRMSVEEIREALKLI